MARYSCRWIWSHSRQWCEYRSCSQCGPSQAVSQGRPRCPWVSSAHLCYQCHGPPTTGTPAAAPQCLSYTAEHGWHLRITEKIDLIAQWKTAVSPVHQHWRYCSHALSYQNIHYSNMCIWSCTHSSDTKYSKGHKQCSLYLVVNSGTTNLASRLGANGLVKQYDFTKIATAC